MTTADPDEDRCHGPGARAFSSSRLLTRFRARAVFLGSICLVGLVALFLLMYLTAIHNTTPDSDGAGTLLAGQAIGHGRLLLHGWALSPDSFWTIDALFYTLAIWAVGMSGALLYMVPALIASLIVVMGILVARSGFRGGSAFVGATIVVATLAAPSHAMASFFLLGSMHMGTVLWSLVTFLALSRGRFGLRWCIAVAFLAGGMLGDLMMVAYGTVPVFVAGVAESLRQRDWRSGFPQSVAAIAAIVLAVFVREIAHIFGVFSIRKGYATVSWNHLSLNLMNLVRFGAELVGARTASFGTGGVPVGLQLVHDVSFVLLFVSVLLGSLRLLRGALTGSPGIRPPRRIRRNEINFECSDRLDNLLTVACFGPPVTFVVLSNGNPLSARYLAASVVFASVLAGRTVARWWATTNLLWLKQRAAAATLAVLLCLAAIVGYTISSPSVGPPATELAAWLELHHLQNGIGDFWSSNITTVESRDVVTVRPVLTLPKCVLQRFPFGSTAEWYKGKKFDFFVYNASWSHGSGPDGWVSAERRWGHAARIYKVGTYRVLTWPHAISVSPYLTKPRPRCSV